MYQIDRPRSQNQMAWRNMFIILFYYMWELISVVGFVRERNVMAINVDKKHVPSLRPREQSKRILRIPVPEGILIDQK